MSAQPDERPDKTVASASVAAGDPAISTSFRFHRPRGPICGRGHCGQCEVATATGPMLACQLAHDVEITPERKSLRPLGRLAERFPPWFYERRFRAPRPVRWAFLNTIRHLSAAPSLAAEPARPPVSDFVETEAELVTVGSPGGSAEAGLTIDLRAGELALGIYGDRTLGVLSANRLMAVRFERLVLATGGYERLPPIPGNDLPGVLGLDALELYGRAERPLDGVRIAAWAPRRAWDRIEQLAGELGASIAWMDDRAPTAIRGRRRVQALVAAEEEIPCDLFVTGVQQPAIELALQAGATASLSRAGLPIVAVDATPDWLELRGAVARKESEVPDVPAADGAFVCLCEDVRVCDLKACVAQGFTQAETIKRRTGAMTGPCQGKLCMASVLATLRTLGVESSPTRARPLARPATLGDLAAHA